jgi:hypothetical protein
MKTKALELAMEKVAALPEATQKDIAEKIIAHVSSVEYLRAELQKGIGSLDRGEGKELHIEEVIGRAHAAHERQ